MTTTLHNPTRERHSSSRAGAIGGLVAAAAFIYGIALFATSLSDYNEGDATAAESVDFLVSHQTTLFSWHLVIYLVSGIAIIPLARSLRERLVDVNPQLADIGAVFAYIWAGLVFAAGMVANVGIAAVADLHETDPAAAEALWSSVITIEDGLGGGNELVGAMWILLVSLAAWGSGRLPTGLNVLGIISAVSGLITLVPGLSDVGIIFGLGSIAWLAWTGIVLFGNPRTNTQAAEVARSQ